SNITKNLVFTDIIPSTITGVNIVESDKSFTLGPGQPPFPVTVSANQTVTIPITFSPQSVGTHTATISLTKQRMLKVSPPVISFGGIVVSTGPVSAGLTLTNVGATALTWGNMLKPAAPYT
ncbi:hypothetical protein BZG36_05754, partial [Bifiguratus adelaidae]